MSKSPIDYDQYNEKIKRKANYYSCKIWGINYPGEVEFFKGQKRQAEIVFWGGKPTIRFKRELANPQLEFCVDDLLVRMLTRWYCHDIGLKKEKAYLDNLKTHGICSKESFFIYNKTTAYTGSIEKRLWDPTIKLIELNLAYELDKGY